VKMRIFPALQRDEGPAEEQFHDGFDGPVARTYYDFMEQMSRSFTVDQEDALADAAWAAKKPSEEA
jgi:hypothetical protein